MTAFWIIAAGMVVAALAFVAPRLLRGAPARRPDLDAVANEVRRQLVTLDQAHRDGHIKEADYRERRQALSEQLLGGLSPEAPAEASPRSPITAVVVVLAAPLFVVLMYRSVGDPVAIRASDEGWLAATQAINAGSPHQTQGQGQGEGDDQAPDLGQAVQGLEARLQQNPEDVDGWYLLGRSYMTLQAFEKARDAYGRANALAPNQPAIMVEYAEALAFASGQPRLPEESLVLLEQALALNPESQKALWMIGLSELQNGRPEEAIGFWQRLMDQLEPGSEIARTLAQQMDEARSRAAGEVPAMPADHPPVASDSASAGDDETASVAAAEAAPATPAAADPAAQAPPASDGGRVITVEVSLAEELAGQVSPSDTVFVFARAANGPPMPLAIQRLAAGQLPVTVRLDESMAMMPAMSIAAFPEVVVGARISKSGDAAARPGDLQALSDPVTQESSGPVRLRIDTVL